MDVFILLPGSLSEGLESVGVPSSQRCMVILHFHTCCKILSGLMSPPCLFFTPAVQVFQASSPPLCLVGRQVMGDRFVIFLRCTEVKSPTRVNDFPPEYFYKRVYL